MKVWLDDIRNPPSKDWVYVTNYNDCIGCLERNMCESGHDAGAFEECKCRHIGG